MDRLLSMGNRLFGKPTTYQRVGFANFTINGVPDFIDRLTRPSVGPFYSVFYRGADFDNAPFTAQVIAKFTGQPHASDTITFDGVTYTAVLTLDNSTPRQFLRGSSPMGAASNLTAAINADPSVSGTFFSSTTTAHPTCSASWTANADGSGSTIVSALDAGMAQDALTASESMYACNLDSKQFYGGGPLVNDLVTVDNTLFRISDVPEPDPEGGIQISLERKAQ